MADKKNNANALFNSLSASGEDLPLLQPEPPPEGGDAPMEGVSLENSPFADSPIQVDFSESDAVFSELRNFGQTGEATPSPTEESPSPVFDLGEPAATPPARSASVAANRAPSKGSTTELPVTTAESLPGWRVDKYLGLVSAWVRLDSEEADPLSAACSVLASNAAARGANAVLSAKLQATGEAQGLLLVGTAVVSSRE